MAAAQLPKFDMNNIWLLGSGAMALDYIKVLRALEANFAVIGRGADSARICQEKTGCMVRTGGLEDFLLSKPAPCTHAIVSVGVEALMSTTMQLLDHGVSAILVEKPAGLSLSQVRTLADRCKAFNADVFVAYNRRFYSSVLYAQRIIADDGGITSFSFEFTEWAHIIGKLQKAEGVLKNWFLANSTHVVDLAFYLGGKPTQLCAFTSGSLDWHSTASVFSGAGVSNRGALFSYQANWESAGRWSVEVMTKNHRLILRPMEKLQIQKRGSVSVDFIDCDFSLDEQFKPGLYLQTNHFLNGTNDGLCSVHYQAEMMDAYCKIAGYIS
jgi:predicted dehydrogenase